MSAKSKSAGVAALLACFAALLAPAANAADPSPRFEGVSESGAVTFFSTTDKLVPGDTDSKLDIYERSFDEGVGGYVTREVSFGPRGGNNAFDVQFLGNNEAGTQVFFSTSERLTNDDQDTANDIYVRDLDQNKTELVSAGDSSCTATGCGTANSGVVAASSGVVADGHRVVFSSAERLSSEDQDNAFDVYVRDLDAPARTILVSVAGPGCLGLECGNGSAAASFADASADGSSVVFTTPEALDAAGDQDALDDLYERDVDSEQTHLVSATGTCPGQLDCTPVYAGISVTGAHVYFETNERISGLDTDSSQDVYDWAGGTAVVASQGPTGGNGTPNALFAGNAPDGSAVFFETTESLVSADGDTGQDVYEFSGGSTSLVSRPAAGCDPPACGDGDEDASVVRSNGVPKAVYDAGSKIFFFTTESLSTEDQDSSFDVYVRDLDVGTTTLVSRADPACTLSTCGNGPNDANLAGASLDGSHAFFITNEPLVDADTDSSQKDVYERSGGQTKLISTGTINGNGPYNAQLRGVSADGQRAVFVTAERLTDEDDFLGQDDIYLRGPSGTLLVSRGNDSELESQLAPPPPVFERTDPASPNASTEPALIGSEAEAAASIKVYTTSECSGEPIATATAEELADPGIKVTVAVGSTTQFRATAEAEGFVSECSAPISYTQQNAAPPPGEEGGGDSSSGGGGIGGGGANPIEGPRPPQGRSYLTPLPRITFGPASKTRARRPVFRFTDATGQDGTSFLCKVDRTRWKACASPVRLKPLKPGRHAFRVLGINGAGTPSPSPSTRSFKLVKGAKR
jgi:hypothetical protein